MIGREAPYSPRQDVAGKSQGAGGATAIGKLIVTIPANHEEAHIAEVIEEIPRLVCGVMSVGSELARGGTAVFDRIENVHARRDNRVA